MSLEQFPEKYKIILIMCIYSIQKFLKMKENRIDGSLNFGRK